MYIAPMPAPDGASHPNRREALVIGSALVGGALLVGCSPADIMGSGAPKTDFGPFGPFVKVAADGSVTVMNKHQEMGQGNHAGLAAIVAEEMDADWSTVKVEHAAANAKVYANSLMGVQGTGGSTAIANSWMQLRKVGASARAMFVKAAADTWKVPEGEIKVKDGVVSHASGKSAHFGDLLDAASKVAPPKDPVLKDPKDFTLIGTDRVRRKDSLAKSTGQAKYTQDVYLPDMLTAVVAHSPKFGGKLKSFDATEALKVPGVKDVFKIATGVAVVATSVHAARKGRDALKIEWDDAKAETRSTPQMMEDYRKIASGALTPADDKWAPFATKGEVGTLDGADVLKAAFDFPYLAHATMEPMNCVAQVDGSKCKLTYGAQGHSLDQMAAATVVLNLPGAIEIETLFAGGSFGRRSSWDSDYVVEAVQIAKHVGKFRPVKLVWTREDDMTAGHYRPMAHHDVAVKTGSDGYPVAWRHRVVIQSFAKSSPMLSSMMVKHNVDATSVEGVAGSPYLAATKAVDAQVFTPHSPVTTLWWRSVGATHSAPVMEHMIDMLAARAKIDPVAYRREMYRRAGKAAERHLAVLNLAVEKSGWDQPLKDGWTRGVAVHESFGSVVANVCEVKIVDGEPKVRRVVVAVDCGVAIAKDQIAAQMEGGTCYGLSAALFGQVTLNKGAPVQTNFDTYRVLRHNEAPKVETYIIASANPPSGVGEPGTPVIMASLPNAIFAATGKPVTSFPIVKA